MLALYRSGRLAEALEVFLDLPSPEGTELELGLGTADAFGDELFERSERSGRTRSSGNTLRCTNATAVCR